MTGLILAAAGSGSRFGSETPKQFLELHGKPVYLCALEKFAGLVGQAVVVVPEPWLQAVGEGLAGTCPRAAVVAGGPRRQDSVCLGLECLDPAVEIVLVHDAARPFVSSRLIRAVAQGAALHGACVPVVPAEDTLKEVVADRVVRTLDRERLYRVQTPQGFETGLLRRAFLRAREDGFQGTDEASLVERLEHSVLTVPGDRANTKITWEEDLSR